MKLFHFFILFFYWYELFLIFSLLCYSLILMALYNLSINQKGLNTLSKTKGIVSLLVWLLQGMAANHILVSK